MHVLVTGATGFLGGALLAEQLLPRDDVRVLVVARGPDAEGRVARSIARFAAPPRRAALAVVEADLTDASALDRALQGVDDVTHVLHLAADTSFRSVRNVRRVNVDATLSLAARFAGSPTFRRFVQVGTAYACGDAPGRILSEDASPRAHVRQPVPYTATKAEAEARLAQVPGLPLVVARPSVVVGHTRLGCGPSASLFWFYRVLHALRRTPRPLEALEDVVPVDWTAAALAHLAFATKLAHGTYHLSAGVAASVSLGDVMGALDDALGSSDEPWIVASAERLRLERSRLALRLGPGDEDRLLIALDLYLRFAALPVEVFDNTRLLGEGVPAPPRFTSWIPACARDARTVYEQMRDDD